MEIVGLTIGVVSLAGLFHTCVQTLEKYDNYKDHSIEARSVATQFKAEKLRFEKWGEAVGFEGDTASKNYHKGLDDPRTFSAVKELFSIIRELCENARSYMSQPNPEVEGLATSHKASQYQSPTHGGRPPESKRTRLKWVLRDKAKRMAQAEQLGVLVQKLYDLVPPDGETNSSSNGKRLLYCHIDIWIDLLTLSPDVVDSSWTSEFRSVLSRIELEIEG
jgi:hypothetical protein